MHEVSHIVVAQAPQSWDRCVWPHTISHLVRCVAVRSQTGLAQRARERCSVKRSRHPAPGLGPLATTPTSRVMGTWLSPEMLAQQAAPPRGGEVYDRLLDEFPLHEPAGEPHS
eukprot:1086576-Prymnesium_polylepis.1